MNTENKLPEPFKSQWIAALRSGEYKQGVFKFFGCDGERCVFGVALDFVNDPRFIKPMQKMAWIRSYIGHDMSDRLMEMNDYDKKTFPELATYIEQNL